LLADDFVSNLDCASLRAMTGSKDENAAMLFGIIMQLLKLCGAIHNFVHRLTFALRRIDLSLSQQLSDCAAGGWGNYLFYNTITPTVYLLVLRVDWDFRS
jgi:hypothetical protein